MYILSLDSTFISFPRFYSSVFYLQVVPSLSIGQGNLFRGQENKEMFFPTTIKFFPTPRDVPVVNEGWVCKGTSGVKGGDFKKSQRDFLLTLFNNNGGPKLGRGTFTRGYRQNSRTRMRTPISVIVWSSVKVRSSVGFRPR
jgi:hypothetical protein